MMGKCKKGDLEYNTSLLHDEINFDWYGIEFKNQDKPIFFMYKTGSFAWKI